MAKNVADEVSAAFKASATQLEDSIFNLVITLTRQKMEEMSPDQAKEEVAIFLRKLIDGLVFKDDNPITNNT